MNRKVKFLLSLLLAAITTILVSCKPIEYYLQQVDKAYGKVTEAGTGVPLESVEVSLGSYQYAVLTNGLGDYVFELAEGTWTINFVKDGYVTTSKVVTVGPNHPKVQVDVPLQKIEPVSPEFVGTWQVSPMAPGRGAFTLTLTATSFTITAADAPPPSPDLETDTGTVTDVDTTAKHFKLTVKSFTVAGEQSAKWALEDVIYVLYSLSGNTLTISISTTGYPDDLNDGASLTRL